MNYLCNELYDKDKSRGIRIAEQPEGSLQSFGITRRALMGGVLATPVETEMLPDARYNIQYISCLSRPFAVS